MADYTVEVIDASVVLYETITDDITVELFSSEAVLYDNDVFVQRPIQSVVNRVWDTVAADFVRWSTDDIDSSGNFYPGPGTFGVDTSDYVVETIQHTRV